MVAYEFAWHETRDFIPSRPRQLFVTQSEKLVEKVEKQFGRLIGYTESGKAQLNLPSPQTEMDDMRGMPSNGHSDVAKSNSDLPRKFSELDARHFPLFVTFDKVTWLFIFFFMWKHRLLMLHSFHLYWKLI